MNIPADVQNIILRVLLENYTPDGIVFTNPNNIVLSLISAQGLRSVNRRWCDIVTKWFTKHWGVPSFAEFFRIVNSRYKWLDNDVDGAKLGPQPGSYLTELAVRYFIFKGKIKSDECELETFIGRSGSYVYVWRANDFYHISRVVYCQCKYDCNCTDLEFSCDVRYAAPGEPVEKRVDILCVICNDKTCRHLKYNLLDIVRHAEALILFANPAMFNPDAFSGSRKIRF